MSAAQSTTETFFFAHARTALWYGLQQLPMKRGQTMLVPEYVCEAVLHPLEDLGIHTVFYPVDDFFVPDWKVIETLMIGQGCFSANADTNSESVKAFLLVHYFGQPQDLGQTRKFCDRYGLWLIEDNAHGHGGNLNGQPLGSFCDMGFSSPRKQLQSVSGGILYLNGEPIEPKKKTLPVYPVSKSKELLRHMIRPFPRLKAALRRKLVPEPDFSDPYSFPEIRMGYFKADTDSSHRILTENWFEHASVRRENWCAWSSFASAEGLRPVWSEPHQESCPWVLPVYASNPEERIHWLNWGRQTGIDLFPWPALPEKVLQKSSTAITCWKHLLCFPLHQKKS